MPNLCTFMNTNQSCNMREVFRHLPQHRSGSQIPQLKWFVLEHHHKILPEIRGRQTPSLWYCRVPHTTGSKYIGWCLESLWNGLPALFVSFYTAWLKSIGRRIKHIALQINSEGGSYIYILWTVGHALVLVLPFGSRAEPDHRKQCRYSSFSFQKANFGATAFGGCNATHPLPFP